jgi:hypothetical protein
MRPRSKNNSRTENIPVENISPDVEIAVSPDSNPAVEAYQKEIKQADEAALALKRQIEALQTSEQIQRQRLEQAQYERQVRLMQMQPPSREQKIEAWKQAGLSEANEQFMWAHPELIDHHEVTRIATQEALASGVKPDRVQMLFASILPILTIQK